MMLFLELALTIVAWKRGWGPKALLPLLIGLGIAFFVGAAVGLGGGTIEQVTPICLLLDFAITGVLITLSIKTPKAEALNQ